MLAPCGAVVTSVSKSAIRLKRWMVEKYTSCCSALLQRPDPERDVLDELRDPFCVFTICLSDSMIGKRVGVPGMLMLSCNPPPEVPSEPEIFRSVVWWCQLHVQDLAGMDEFSEAVSIKFIEKFAMRLTDIQQSPLPPFIGVFDHARWRLGKSTAWNIDQLEKEVSFHYRFAACLEELA